MIITGTRIKVIEYLDIDSLRSRCDAHDEEYSLVIGKKYYTLYFIPLNHFFAKERVFKICPEGDYVEVDEDIEEQVLKFYRKEISRKDLDHFLNRLIEKMNQ